MVGGHEFYVPGHTDKGVSGTIPCIGLATGSCLYVCTSGLDKSLADLLSIDPDTKNNDPIQIIIDFIRMEVAYFGYILIYY